MKELYSIEYKYSKLKWASGQPVVSDEESPAIRSRGSREHGTVLPGGGEKQGLSSPGQRPKGDPLPRGRTSLLTVAGLI
jgi:hypothetical protein